MMKIEKETVAFSVVRVIAIGMLLWAYSKHPIGYYTLLRFVVCATCAYGTYSAMKLGKAGWMFTMAFVAILFNPVIPVYLKRNHWEIIDAVTALFLLLSMPLLRRTQRFEGNKELDNRRYESLKTILWGVFWIIGAIWFVYHSAGNPLDELALIQRGQTVKGYIVDIQESEQDDNGGVDYYYTYTYQVPNGGEITQITKHVPERMQRNLWNSEQPYPVEVEYLSDDPATSRIKGTGSKSVSDLLLRKVGGGSLFLALVIGPAVMLIRNEIYNLRRLRFESEIIRLRREKNKAQRKLAELYMSLGSDNPGFVVDLLLEESHKSNLIEKTSERYGRDALAAWRNGDRETALHL